MGITPGVLPGQANPFQNGIDIIVGFFLGSDNVVGKQRLGDDIPHRHPGVQGRIGILKDHLHLLAQGLQLLLGQMGDIRTV